MRTLRPVIFFLCIILLACLGFSCSKSSAGSSNPQYYMKATIDGVAKTFNSIPASTPVIAVMVPDGNGGMGVNIEGIFNMEGLSKGSGYSELAILVLASDQNDIQKGKTFNTVRENGDVKNEFINTAMQDGAPVNSYESFHGVGDTGETFSCTITDRTDTYIKGTFTSVIYLQGLDEAPGKNVTNGEFCAKITAP